MVTKKELFQRGGVVEPGSTHERQLLHLICSNDAQRHSSLAGKNAIDSFVDRAIAPHDDYRTPFLSSTSGEFFRFSPLRRFHILCMFALGATTHYCTMFGHIATIGSRIEDYKRTTRGRRCLHSASPYVGQENLH